MLFKLKHTFFIMLVLLFTMACHSKKQLTGMEKSAQYKEKLNKKKKDDAIKSRAKTRERQYNIQATSTKKRWDENSEKSNTWVKNEFHRKSLNERIRSFFDNFKREPKPDEGLYTERQKRRSKGNIFQRFIKKIKKKKRKK